MQGLGEELGKLNEEYEAKFPGLRFVVFVNGRGREEIMRIMRERIARGDWEGERNGAVEVSFEFLFLCSLSSCENFFWAGACGIDGVLVLFVRDEGLLVCEILVVACHHASCLLVLSFFFLSSRCD